ncbi:MAG TPA: c-type cytochrome [Pyrinomonadaceae bacterium]|nr:c-type cytochrome [Pyrinomonadaceae bacterium]
MKKLLKILAVIIFLLVAGVAIFLTYIVKFKPNIPIEEVKIEYTPERIERGKYLANNVTQCIDCHSTRDWSKYSGPPIPGTEGKGGEIFDEKIGFPGKYYAANITPAHLKDWSDGELFRAITAGVSKDGRPLFPIMPYPYFGKMDREDIYSIIAYIRSLPPVQNEIPPSQSNFPMSIIIHIIPSKPEFSSRPSPTDKVAYGKYLATSASCIECHTPFQKGQIIEEQAFSGGRYFPMPGGLIASANITPDKETGIGSWDENAFIERFKMFDKTNGNNISDNVKEGDFNSIMPWQKYAGMSREDLSAIFAYLKTVKPISNKVPKNTYLK